MEGMDDYNNYHYSSCSSKFLLLDSRLSNSYYGVNLKIVMTKAYKIIIFINMRIFINRIKETIFQKKGVLILLVLLSVVAIVLGVIASVNFSGSALGIDLGNIAYVKFLKNDCSFFSMFFRTALSLMIFVLLICVCGIKPFLFPFSVLFYCYLVYSQTVIFMSIILIYGFFNCVIVSLLLLLYILFLIFVFVLLVAEILNKCGCNNYFKTIFNWGGCNLLLYLLMIVALTFLFALILNILKSFVILLVYW